jgi:hypothetical protein
MEYNKERIIKEVNLSDSNFIVYFYNWVTQYQGSYGTLYIFFS